MTPASSGVVLRGVSRRFGYRWILSDVSLEIPEGELVLLVGSNGAGKTTLLRIIAGLLKPTRGVVERPSGVGFVAHETMLYSALTAHENLRFVARLHGLTDMSRVSTLLEQLGLAAAARQPIGTFSRGMLQRLAIARALLPDPGVLLLDEPLNNLDDAGTRLVVDLLLGLREQGRALVVATHQLVELTPLASRVGYLVGGRLAALEPVENANPAGVRRRFRELTG